VITVVEVPWEVDNVSGWLVVETSDVDGTLDDDAEVVTGIVLVKVVVMVVSPVLHVVV